MADDAGDKQGSTWPLPKFYFSVQLGDDKDVKFSDRAKPIQEGAPHREATALSSVRQPALRRCTIHMRTKTWEFP